MVSISILLPAYNGERYIAEQIESILDQTFPDFRLLIFDDGSTDCTGLICHRYARLDPRVEFVRSNRNRGQAAALRELLSRTDSPYIAFSDQDDIWLPRKLESLANGIGDASLAYGRSDLIDAAHRPLGYALLDALGISPSIGRGRLDILLANSVSAHASLVRRNLLTDAVFGGGLPFDWAFAMRASFDGGIVYVPEAITLHRLHDANQTNFFELRGGKANARRRGDASYLRRIAEQKHRFAAQIELLGDDDFPDAELRNAARSIRENACYRYICGFGPLRRHRRSRDLVYETLAPMISCEAEARTLNRLACDLSLGKLHQRLILSYLAGGRAG